MLDPRRHHRRRVGRQRRRPELLPQSGPGSGGDHRRCVHEHRRRRLLLQLRRVQRPVRTRCGHQVGESPVRHRIHGDGRDVDGGAARRRGGRSYLQGHRSASPAQVWAAINADTTKGVISECCGDPDKLLHVTPAATPPSAPSAPSAPRSLTARPANRSVTLRWAAPLSTGGAPIVDYRIQRSANGGRTWRTVTDGVSTARRTTVGGLTNGHRYYFRVAARNRVGCRTLVEGRCRPSRRRGRRRRDP